MKWVILFILMLPFVNSYEFTLPSPYYYDKENIKVNTSFISEFEAFSEYFDVNIEFKTSQGQFDAYTYCYSLGGRVDIVMYLSSWIDYDHHATLTLLEHEVMHSVECRRYNRYPTHSKSFYEIDIWRD